MGHPCLPISFAGSLVHWTETIHPRLLSKPYGREMTLKPEDGRRLAFSYSVVWLITLFVLSYFWARGRFDGELTGISTAAIASVWAGCLGAVTISLRGIYEHWLVSTNHPRSKPAWSNEYLLWHFGRPATGAVVGVIVFIVFQAANPSSTPSAPALAAASFVLGLQESRFFDWIKQVGAAIIASTGKSEKPPPQGKDLGSG